MDVIEFPNPIEVVEFLRMFGVITVCLIAVVFTLNFLAYPPDSDWI